MKILIVVGARPQFIKAAMVSAALQSVDGNLKLITAHTGQHYDFNMSGIFFDQLALAKPDHHLGIGGLSSASMTARMTEGLEKVIATEQPDCVVVFGDTDSTLAGALAAAKSGVRLAHVEAGLRSFDRRMPEEINRRLTDHISDLLYTTSDVADENLRQEGISGARVLQVGDVMYDACLRFGLAADMTEVPIPRAPFIIATLHRAATTDDPKALAQAVSVLCEFAREITVLLPLHPRTRRRASDAGLLDRLEQACRVVEPIGYLEMLKLLKHCAGVVTDSGGLQKEAFYMGRRCVVLRDRTEWVELVTTGQTRLHDPCAGSIMPADLLEWLLQAASPSLKLYGGGEASTKLAHHLVSWHG